MLQNDLVQSELFYFEPNNVPYDILADCNRSDF